MKRWGVFVVVLVVVLLAVGLVVTWVANRRVDAAQLACQNNLRALSQFAHLGGDRIATPPLFLSEKGKERPKPDQAALDKLRDQGLPMTVPAGTVANQFLTPDRRLSWVVELLPSAVGRQDPAAILASIDKAAAWDAEANRAAAVKRLAGLICPGNPLLPPADAPAWTQYVGAGGVGADAATLPATSPRAGCFRYDASTPFDAITDGLSQTVLFPEVSADIGPWLQGGPATVRVYDPENKTRPAIGPGGRFGGNHPGGAYFCFADTSARFLTEKTNPAVLAGLFTIAGGASDPIPGD